MTNTKVLIIDDEDLVRDALVMVLERSGFNVMESPSAIKALAICQNETFDIILTDLVMPEMDGVLFIRNIRNAGIETPIISLTGGARVGQQNMSEEALEAGALLALRKPVNKNQILEAINQALSL
ncbi:response regulator [Terasakiella sp. A23]|uniref:response regulator n=1 Tax=Terasakiella sp. FCG-A23 TaxID=3080561 RepID=UPI002954C4A0|nr:response regulator [Terasakiella sp. A23]MDV7338725.1 response regulator [Terasakiella sp. A23]